MGDDVDQVLSLAPLPRESSASIIAEQVRAGIASGLFKPGQQINEAHISEQLGISRGLLREAMQRLVQEGLLRSERFRGLFVIELDEDDVRDVYLTREGIERAAVKGIFQRGEVDLDPLVTIVDAMRDIAEGRSGGSLAELDLSFHMEMVKLSGSVRSLRAMQSLIVETGMCLRGPESRSPDPEERVREHQKILTALLERDEAEALRLITEHMSATAATLVARSADDLDAADTV